MSCNLRFIRSKPSSVPARRVRRISVFALAWLLFSVGMVVAAFGDGPILGNPAEKFFDEPSAKSSNDSSRKPRFADSEILPTASQLSKIRQTSGEAPSVWDNPAPGTAGEATLADWGVGPSLVAPAIGDSTTPNRTAPAFTPPNGAAMGTNGMPAAPQGFGFGVGPTWGQTPTANPAATAPTAVANPYAQIQQNPYVNPYYGFGYYDPNNGNLYANPYAGGMNYGAYAPNGGFNGFGGGYDPYNPTGNYGNAMGNYGGFYNPMLMMGQQTPNYLFPQGFNGPMPNREAAENAAAGEKKSKKDKETEEEEKKPGSEWTMQRLMPLHVTSPLGETLLKGAKTLSPFSTPTGPDKGCGQPLLMRSWQDHPYYFGGFVGYIYGSQLVDNMIDQNSGANGGLKLGYYFNDYWGVESRLHFASIDIQETDYGREVYDSWYAAAYPDGPYRPLTTRSNHLTTFDVSVQYYPLGNAKWRPFFTYGLGVTRESFIDTYGVNNRVDAISMPIGVGLRYWWNEHLAIQADLIDNIVFSTGQAKTQGNFAFTVGVAYSFGTSKKCRPTAYWPYTPSMGSKW